MFYNLFAALIHAGTYSVAWLLRQVYSLCAEKLIFIIRQTVAIALMSFMSLTAVYPLIPWLIETVYHCYWTFNVIPPYAIITLLLCLPVSLLSSLVATVGVIIYSLFSACCRLLVCFTDLITYEIASLFTLLTLPLRFFAIVAAGAKKGYQHGITGGFTMLREAIGNPLSLDHNSALEPIVLTRQPLGEPPHNPCGVVEARLQNPIVYFFVSLFYTVSNQLCRLVTFYTFNQRAEMDAHNYPKLEPAAVSFYNNCILETYYYLYSIINVSHMLLRLFHPCSSSIPVTLDILPQPTPAQNEEHLMEIVAPVFGGAAAGSRVTKGPLVIHRYWNTRSTESTTPKVDHPSESKDMSGNTADTHHVQGTSQNLRRRALQNYPSESKDMSGNTADTHHVRSASQSPRLKK